MFNRIKFEQIVVKTSDFIDNWNFTFY